MKTNILLFLLLIVVQIGSAQSEKSTYKKAIDTFQKHFNADDAAAVFEMFASDMKIAVPFDKINTAMTQLHANVGDLKSVDFTSYENGSVAAYKAQFEKGILNLYLSLNSENEINGLLFKPYVQKEDLPQLTRNTTSFILPFKEEWDVLWGGDTKELNYHIDSPVQKNAFDFLILNEQGSSFKTDGRTNEDYYAFGKELIAPADGEVVLVVDGVKDNTPGEMNPVYVPGNTVIIKTKNNEFLFFAHFKQHSIVVKQGQQVQQGQLLGLCGNSGNSSEPHLHFHIQNVENMVQATGAKSFFDRILVNGTLKMDYSPIKNDRIQNE